MVTKALLIHLSIPFLPSAVAKLSFGRQEETCEGTQKDRGADQSAGGIELEIFHRVR